MSSRVIFLAMLLMIGRQFPFAQSLSSRDLQASKPVLPKPAVALPAGTWKYQSRDEIPANPNAVNTHSTFSVTIKDDGNLWTVTAAWEFPEGPVTDSLTLDKDTLVLRREVFKHFLHRDQPWKPIAVDAEFSGDKATGTRKYVNGQNKPFAVSVSGPLFAVSTIEISVSCLPLADGYSTSFHYFDVERLALNPEAADREKLLQLAVLGTERVTVPAGTFNSWKIELTSPDGLFKETVWTAKDSRVPVKTYTVSSWNKNGRKSTASSITEMVP